MLNFEWDYGISVRVCCRGYETSVCPDPYSFSWTWILLSFMLAKKGTPQFLAHDCSHSFHLYLTFFLSLFLLVSASFSLTNVIGWDISSVHYFSPVIITMIAFAFAWMAGVHIFGVWRRLAGFDSECGVVGTISLSTIGHIDLVSQ